MDCIFCRIASGTVSVPALYEDEQVIAFGDIAPQAPVHFLVIPREHLKSLAHTAREGFRTVINSGEHGGQTVSHLHVHVLGGRPMGWPPG